MKRSCMRHGEWLLVCGLAIAVLAGACQPTTQPSPQPNAPAKDQSPDSAAQPQAPTPTTQSGVKPAAPPAEGAPTANGPATKAGAVAKLEPDGTRQAETQRVRAQLRIPLVDDAAQLQPLDPQSPIWIDPQKTKVVMVGAVCQRQAPLELFACMEGTKEYESILAVPVPAKAVHAALLATGVEAGHPVQFGEKFVPPSGPTIEITLIWKDDQGKKQTARAQDWIRNMQTHKAMQESWVFVGSQMGRDPETGKEFYVADTTGNLICVSNFTDSVLDLPMASTDSDASLVFEAFTEHIPNRGTPVTLVLTPKKEPVKK